MLFATANYERSFGVDFDLNKEGALTVNIQTSRLCLRSITASQSDCDNYVDLYGDPEVMTKFKSGHIKTREEVTELIKSEWVKRWKENDPYSGFAVFLRDTGEFWGHAILEHGDEPGQVDMQYLSKKNYWGKGYGKEMAHALVNEYAPATVQAGYTMHGKVLTTIQATVRADNLASTRIIEGLGMRKIAEIQKYGALRSLYTIDVPNPVVQSPLQLRGLVCLSS